MVGTQVLHYRIIEKLGEGGMGEVYLAHDAKLERNVALKFLPESVRSDAEARERLIREAKAASKLHHTNIVSIFAIESDDDLEFIVMEYVAGRSLTDLIRAGEVDAEKTVDIARQIGSALSAAHEAGIVHRDMKPDNILVTEKGEVKILDFGLAKLKGTSRLTEIGSTMGTMAYMSPEQTSGQDVDHRSDIFSFGVILYEMITGRRPFQGEHSAALTYAIVNETPEPLARYKSDVSGELQRIIDKALRKDRTTRYQSVPDMLADLGIASTARQPAYPAPGRTISGRWLAALIVVFLIVASAVVFTLKGRGPNIVETPPGRIMLAVLPFENVGSPDDEYFADGMTEEITTHLAKLSGLGVISRTSAMAYKASEKKLREIGEELGVDYVLEGTIRWDKSGSSDRVRINPQLIRVNDDTHLWAETYDRVLDQIFSLQTEIAEDVAAALDVTLLEPERAALAATPTEDLEAYNYYLRGREYYGQQASTDQRELAKQMFERAVEVDSEFSLAHAWLARMYSNDYFNARFLDTKPLERAKEAADEALRSGGPEGHLAMGYYHYYGSRDYDRALEEFAIAEKGEPNNSELLEAMGYVYRRRGDWDDALRCLRRASELDPRSYNIAQGYLETLMTTRQIDAADRVVDHGLEFAPDYWPYYMWKFAFAVFGDGDIEEARAALETATQYGSAEALAAYWELYDFLKRDYETALTRQAHPPPGSDAMGNDSTGFYTNRSIYSMLAGDTTVAMMYADSAVALALAKTQVRPNDHDAVASLGLAYACRGDKEDAIRYGERAVELLPMDKDAVCENEKAIDGLEYLLTIPSYMTVPFLRVNPAFDPLRDDPRFQQLVRQDV
jgi:serine/threonine protein kinase/tetratricopeptide (TPR) repeat protein